MDWNGGNRCFSDQVLRKLCRSGVHKRRKFEHTKSARQTKRKHWTPLAIISNTIKYAFQGHLAPIAAYTFVGFICILCYVNSLHGDLVHDDVMAITRNPDLRPETPLSDLWTHDFWGTPIHQNNSHKSYRPLTVLSFRLNYAFGGLDTFGYHVVNVALHVLATWLLMLLCHVMLRMHLASVALGGLLFASHPIHTEAVSGIVGRAELLCACFFLGSVMSYFRILSHMYPLDNKDTKDERRNLKTWIFTGLTILLSAAAMLAKEQGIMALPFCLVLDTVISRSTAGRHSRTLSLFVPLCQRMCALLLSMVLLLAIRFHIMGWETPQFQPEDNPAAFHPDWTTGAMTYCYIYAFNMVLLLCPSTLSYDWQMGSIPLLRQLTDIRNLASLSLFVSLLLITRYCLQKQKKTTSPCRLPATVGLFLLVLPFLPAANIVCPVGFVVAERVLYIPSMGLILLLLHTFEVCWAHVLNGSRTKQRALVVCYLLLCGMWMSRTIARNNVWSSREALFRSGLETLSENAKMHYNWANFMKDEGNKTEAEIHYNQAIRLWPSYASAFNNLGTVKDSKTQAEMCYKKAIDLHPKHAGALFNLGNLYSSQGHNTKAETALRRAIALDPVFADAHSSLAVLLEERGDHIEAEISYRAAISLRPHDPNLHNNLAVFLASRGDTVNAFQHYEKAYEIDGTHHISVLNAARLHRNLGQNQEASRLFLRACSDNPDEGTWEEAAVFFFNNDQSKVALSLLKKLLKRKPQDVKYKLYYAQLISKNGRLRDAESIYKHILAADAGNVEALYQLSKVYGLQKRHNQAIQLLRKASQLVKDDPSYLARITFELGNHYKDTGVMDLAFQYYSRSIELNPDIVDAHLNLGVFHHIRRNYQKAEKHYVAASKLEPQNKLLLENIKKLRSHKEHFENVTN